MGANPGHAYGKLQALNITLTTRQLKGAHLPFVQAGNLVLLVGHAIRKNGKVLAGLGST